MLYEESIAGTAAAVIIQRTYPEGGGSISSEPGRRLLQLPQTTSEGEIPLLARLLRSAKPDHQAQDHGQHNTEQERTAEMCQRVTFFVEETARWMSSTSNSDSRAQVTRPCIRSRVVLGTCSDSTATMPGLV